ncbi:MAG TPA: hypothetical protein VF377_16340 [Acidimicrobiia bacterium]
MTCLVFDDISAAECALALQDTVKGIDLARVGLSGLRGMRVAAHAAPVFDGWDPVAGTRLRRGSHPNRPKSHYVGTLETAKGYGALLLYSLRSRRPSVSGS